jgi:hypothetical protein
MEKPNFPFPKINLPLGPFGAAKGAKGGGEGLLGSALIVHLVDLKDAIYGASGPQALLPLFHHLYSQSHIHSSMIAELIGLLGKRKFLGNFFLFFFFFSS